VHTAAFYRIEKPELSLQSIMGATEKVRNPTNVRSKVALRFTSTSARHPPIAVSAIAE
jgi:hypothetical protein